MNLVDLDLQKRREHRLVGPLADSAGFVIAKACMCREAASADYGIDRSVEDVDEPMRVFAIRVTAHRRLVHCDLAASGLDQRDQFVADDRQKRLGYVEAVGIFPVRLQSPAQRVRPRHARLERDCGSGLWDCGLSEPSQSLPLINHAQAAWRAQFAGDPVFPALVVPGRAEATRQGLLQLYAFQKPIERQVEIEPRLLAVCDYVQPGGDLVVNRRDHGVFLQLGAIDFAELVEMLAGEFKPAGKWIAADDGCS